MIALHDLHVLHGLAKMKVKGKVKGKMKES